jgi:hypothetical protein
MRESADLLRHDAATVASFSRTYRRTSKFISQTGAEQLATFCHSCYDGTIKIIFNDVQYVSPLTFLRLLLLCLLSIIHEWRYLLLP